MAEIMEFVQRHPLLVGAFFAILVMIVWTEVQRLTRNFKDLTPQEAVQLINHEAPLVLDVREHNELSSGVIKGAKHVPMSAIRTRISELDPGKHDSVLVYCRSGSRSLAACRSLKNHGFEHVYNLKGGIIAWEGENLPTAKK